jgi:hypothetical protein
MYRSGKLAMTTNFLARTNLHELLDVLYVATLARILYDKLAMNAK